MICKRCGYEFMGKFCPECGKRANSVEWQNIVGPVLAVIVFFISTGTFAHFAFHYIQKPEPESPQTPQDHSSETIPQSQNQIELPQWAPKQIAPPADNRPLEDKHLTIENKGILVTEFGFKQSYGNRNYSPRTGNIFVTFEFTVQNNASNKIEVIRRRQAEFDGFVYEVSENAVKERDDAVWLVSYHLGYGKKIHGVVGYEVPEDWREARIRFGDIEFTYMNPNHKSE